MMTQKEKWEQRSNQIKKQLGMNPGTAANRLRRDVLFTFVQKANEVCYRCSEPMTRDTFSIEHKKPWLNSEDPLKLYFDLDNVAFSHISCNSSHARKPTKIKSWARGEYNKVKRDKLRSENPDLLRKIRRDQYLRTGK